MPQRVDALSGLKECSVAARQDNSYAVAASGELFTWRAGQYGMLRHGDFADQHAPRRVEALQRVIAFSAGIVHTIAVTCGGNVLGWGRAEALGLPDTVNSSEYMLGFKGPL